MASNCAFQAWTVTVLPGRGFPKLLPASDAPCFEQTLVPFAYARGSEATVRAFFEKRYPGWQVQLSPAEGLPFYDLSGTPLPSAKQ